jgi:ribonuclease Z
VPDAITKLGMFMNMNITAYPLKHKVASLGYLLEEPEKKGKLDAVKAKSLGITNPRDLGQLSAGRDVTLPDGTTVKSSDVIGETRKGKKYLFLGDTCDSDSAVDAARNCDVLVHEVKWCENRKVNLIVYV